MKTIIAGSRKAPIAMTDLMTVIEKAGWPITEVVSGHSGIVDMMGEQWARGLHLPVTTFEAAWTTFGKSAGPRRNKQMAEYAEALIAVWDGKSRGTLNMIKEATKRQLKVYVHQI